MGSVIIIGGKQDMKDVCKKHKREYEMYCKACTLRTPLCAGCACDHYIESHGMQMAFFEEDINKSLEKLDEGLSELNKKQEIITKYTRKAEQITKDKDKTKRSMDAIIKGGRNFYESQAKVVVQKHEDIVKCYEAIMKATNDCEHSIKLSMGDPMRMKEIAKKLTKEKKYMSAMKEVEGALIPDTKLDESKIQFQMEHYDTLIKEFTKFLADIDTGVFDIPKGKKLKEEKEALDVSNAGLKSKSLLFIHLLADLEQANKDLTDSKDENDRDKKEIGELKESIADLRKDKVELQGTTTI
jgi:hypothetical protein